MKKRNLFEELKEGIDEITRFRSGKLTLKNYRVDKTPQMEVTPEVIRETRERLNLSRAVFAHELHISPRTLEKWEQGRAKPNEQAATLILLVRQYPDILERLKKLAA